MASAAISSKQDRPERFEALRPYLDGANHVDVKRIEGSGSLDRFILGMLSYLPWWLRLLYGARAVLAMTLGLKTRPAESGFAGLIPRRVSFAAGDMVSFFTVRSADPGRHWIGETPEDRHLKAFVAVLAEDAETGRTVFSVVTIVHYMHWTGPVYFNLIRPFHHLVVSRMARAGAAFAVDQER